MKKWILVFMMIVIAGFILWSCSEDNGGTEPSNNAPVINNLTASPTSVQKGGTSTLTCNATDADNDTLFYTWQNTDGTISGTGPSITWTAPNTNGNYVILVTVTDGQDSDSDTKEISVDSPDPGEIVFIQGGTFQMGDHFNDNAGDGMTENDELPLHSVTMSDFYIGSAGITQAEWASYMPLETSIYYGIGDNHPVYYVSWYSVIVYCNKRSIAEGLNPCYSINDTTDVTQWDAMPTSQDTTGVYNWDGAICNWSANGYRLPTEAEWEYAARGGLSGQRFPNGATISHSTNGDTQANFYSFWYGGSPSCYYDVSPTSGYNPDYNGKVSPVGSFPPNGYGLYDMSGNLCEWCWDWYGDSYYTTCNDQGVVSDPTGPARGTRRVGRDGGYSDSAFYCRISSRLNGNPYDSDQLIVERHFGFRVARIP